MNSIYITSFARAKHLPSGVVPFSAAVYQPKGYDFPKAQWADIRRDGAWIRPRDFLSHDNPLIAYREALLNLWSSRLVEIEQWLSLREGPTALCCWCPYDKAAQRQLKDWGSFVCHTAVIGEYLSQEFKVPVWYDSDRLRLTTLTQNWNVPQREEPTSQIALS